MYSFGKKEDKEKEVYKVMRYSVIFLVCGVLLASCGSKKHVMGSNTGNIPDAEKGISVSELVQTINSKRIAEPAISAKINLSLNAGVNSARVGGSLKMKRNDVIQISLVALGLMEVGRLELTPDYMMVVDRVNHQYVKSSYADVDFLNKAGIDFYTFQSLFWDELFVLNGKGEAPTDNQYSFKVATDGIQLQNSKSNSVALTFLVNAANMLVGETGFFRAGSEIPVLKWKYSEWAKLGEQSFPGSMKISFTLDRNSVEALFKISNVKPDSSWETRTEINKNRYSEISLQAAFQRILRLAE